MGAKLLLKISAVLMFINAIAHLAQHLQWKTATDPAYAEVVRQMTSQKIPVAGVVRSMGDYYDGYGYITAVFLVLLGVLFWALSDISAQYPAVGLKLLIPLDVFLVALVVNALIFFNPMAAAFSSVSTMICTWAIVQLHSGHLDTHLGNVK
jgi:phage shock protein PspC (stress-responsive transcriptional regulator)